MTVLSTLDIIGLTPEEYRAIIDHMGVEKNPASGIYMHLAAAIEGGYRITEVWDHEEGFQKFLQEKLLPAAQSLGIARETTVTVKPLRNLFAPRGAELSGLAKSLPGGPAGFPNT